MRTQNEPHGDENIPMQPTPRDYELALEQVIETIMDCGMWPEPKRGGFTRSVFDLYEFLAERQDSSFWLEMYLAVITNANMFDRTQREIKTVEAMLADHFRGSQIVEIVALDISREK